MRFSILTPPPGDQLGAKPYSTGTPLGLAAGYTLCFFADRQQWIPLAEEVYSLRYVPFQPRWTDGVLVSAVSLAVSLLATSGLALTTEASARNAWWRWITARTRCSTSSRNSPAAARVTTCRSSSPTSASASFGRERRADRARWPC